MSAELLTSTLVTMLVTVDPPGLAPIFLALTVGMTQVERRAVAVRASVIATAILAVSALMGDWLLRQLGIGLPAFRIAGGLFLFWVAFEMVFEKRTDRKAQTAETAITIDHIRSIAAFPLAIPLMAGPGAITAAILSAGRTEGNLVLLAGIIGVICIVTLICFVVFLAAERLERFLGTTGRILLGRLLGVILAALAIQFVIDGVKAAALA
jgi:multiple antibiotic resistance protein